MTARRQSTAAHAASSSSRPLQRLLPHPSRARPLGFQQRSAVTALRCTPTTDARPKPAKARKRFVQVAFTKVAQFSKLKFNFFFVEWNKLKADFARLGLHSQTDTWIEARARLLSSREGMRCAGPFTARTASLAFRSTVAHRVPALALRPQRRAMSDKPGVSSVSSVGFRLSRSGRFSGETDPLMEQFNASIGYDKRMWKQDGEDSFPVRPCMQSPRGTCPRARTRWRRPASNRRGALPLL